MTVALLEALTFGLGRLADAAADAGHRLCLLTGDRSIYTHELAALPAGRIDVIDIDTTDIAACEAALRGVADLAGVISSTDTWALPGAEITARLGLPGPAVAAVRGLRDKGVVRAALHAHGLSRAAAIAVSADGIADAAEAVGFPFIVKDSAGTSSRAVWLIRDSAELDRVRREAAGAPLKGHLVVEPFFAGPLYSAETVTWQGRTRLLGVLSRQLSPEPARREEAAAFPVAFPAADLADLEQWIARVLAAAGHGQGFAHTEFVLTVDGPEVVEINARIGGALVGEALCRSLETNVYTATVSMALGERPALLDAPLGGGPAVAFVLVYPGEVGTLTGWTGLDRLAGFPGAPEWYPTAEVGGQIRHLGDQRGCTGILLAEGGTAELALHRALAAAGGIVPVIAPA
ncbi:ATP-grasp domain-containing protein [Actinokineospora iranica]|uniref:ATP-grasp domain-containing protein n=1 Tax=Actinokineospora iranica TaxID=1271860 RepID=A0A1G6LCU4_9PSEU|nr:ATP-grasp domain-containing protein [Actinokineospora iranica]SDC41021.1 ATP-grasp domain-containing protein [Actinokineospora iranica]